MLLKSPLAKEFRYAGTMQMLYHIARKEDWEKAKITGTYTISTLGKTLDQVGYIHMSFAPQVKLVADFIYTNTTDLVLLKINPDKLTAQVKVEPVGSGKKFPHLYGPLNVTAVVEIRDYAPGNNGEFPAVFER